MHIGEKQCQCYLAVNSNNNEYLFQHIISKAKYNTCLNVQWHPLPEQFYSAEHCASSWFFNIYYQFEGYSAEE